MKQVMNRAWEIAKEGQRKFGGKVSEYIGEAMKMAWAEVKNEKMTMEEIAKLIEGKVHGVQVNVWERYGKRRIYVNKGFKNCVTMLEFDDQDNLLNGNYDSIDIMGAHQAGNGEEFEAINAIIKDVA